MLRWMILSISLPLFLAGCATPCPREPAFDPAKPGGRIEGSFIGRSIDYYHRGQSYAEVGQWEEAVADYRVAICQYDQDQRRAYADNHFYRYFPNRELGIALLAQVDRVPKAQRDARLAASIQALETSLRQFPNARAAFYLEKARLLQIDFAGGDQRPPAFEIARPEANAFVGGDSLGIEGVVEGVGWVKSIRIAGQSFRNTSTKIVNGTRVWAERSQPTVPFEVVVPLDNRPEGATRLELEATDLSGNTRRVSLPIRIDRQGPVVGIDRFDQDDRGRLRVEGRIRDARSGVSKARLADRPLPVSAGEGIQLEERLPSPNASVEITAEDRVGNETTIILDPDQTISQRLQIELEPPPPARTQAARVIISGRVRSPSGIRSLHINDAPIRSSAGRKTQELFFSHHQRLPLGDNIVTIKVQDRSGQVAERRVSIERQPTPENTLSERLVVAQTQIACARCGPEQPNFTQALLESLRQGERFRMVDRRDVQALFETSSRCQDLRPDQRRLPRCAELAQNRLGAEALLVGQVVRHEAPNQKIGLELEAQIVRTATGKTLGTLDAYEEADPGAVAQSSEPIAQGLEQRVWDAFPLVRGTIRRQEGAYWITGLSGRHNVWDQMPTRVYPNDESTACDAPLYQVEANRSLIENNRVVACGELTGGTIVTR